MSGGDFDIGKTLRKRLQEITLKKGSIQAKTDTAKDQLQKLFSKSKPTRQTTEQVNAKINELETQRTSTSLSLSAEKSILRQIDQLKKINIQILENKTHERIIQEKKTEVEALRTEMRSITAQMAELESAIGKIDLANRLGCTTNDLQTHPVDCPKEKLGEVIGKGGSNIKSLEKKTGCIIDVDKVKSVVHLRGNLDAIQKGITEIENITLSIEDEVRLTSEVHSFLFGNGMAPYKELRKNHEGVYIDLSRESKLMKMRGKTDAITALKQDIEKINVIEETIELDAREAGLVIGKGGATIKTLTDKFEVAIDVKDTNDTLSVVKIVGISLNVAEAVKEINNMIFENKDVETAMVVSTLFRNKFLEKSGALIKELQKNVNKALDSNAIRLQFEGRDKDGSEMSTCALLEIRSPRMNHPQAVELVKKHVEEYESKTLIIKIEPYMGSTIIGKGGEKINELKKMGKGATIDLDRVVGEVSVLANDEATKELIKVAIEDIIAENQILKIPVKNSMMGLVFGAPGKGIRSKLVQNQVYLNQDGADSVTLKGRIENITEGAGILRDFIASNYTVAIPFASGDGNLLGRKDSILSIIEKEDGVKTYLVRSKGIVEIRGTEEKAKAAETKVHQFLHGGDGLSVLKISVPDSIIGAMIGKGGANIAKLEKENVGTNIDVNSNSHIITIRGEEDLAYECRGAIMKEMMRVQAKDSIRIEAEVHDHLSKASNIRKITNNLPVNVTLSTSQARLSGNCIDVETVRFAIEELISGSYQGVLKFSPSLYEKVNSAEETEQVLNRIRDEMKVSAEFQQAAQVVQFLGKRSNVKRAKGIFMEFMESSFSSDMTKFKVAKYLAKFTAETKTAIKIAADTGSDIIFDHDLSAFLVQAETESRLQAGLECLKSHVETCEKKVLVLRIESSESWILASLISSQKDTLAEIQESTNCSVELFKDELVITILKRQDADVDAAKEKVLALVEKCRKENVFVDLPESSMPHFIGQSSKHIKSFASSNAVRMERVKKATSRIRIYGDAIAVKNATSAVSEWIKKWEQKNPGSSMDVDGKTLASLLDNKPTSAKKKISRDNGVKIDVYSETSRVVIRGGKGDSHAKAMGEIKALADMHREEAKEAEQTKKVSAPLRSIEPNLETQKSPVKPVKKIASEPIKAAVPAVVVEEPVPKESQNKEELQTVSKLFNFLKQDDGWDASTLTSVSDNVEEGYFRSASGFTIRL